MKKILLLILVIIPSVINVYNVSPIRAPAMDLYSHPHSYPHNPYGREIQTHDPLDSIQKACDKTRIDDGSYLMCFPYLNTKKNVENEANRYVRIINDSVPEPLAFVSGMLLKSLYEKRVQLEVKTGVGDPSVSISNGETNVSWKFNYKF